MLAVSPVAARRDGNHPGIVARAQDRGAVTLRGRRAHDVGAPAGARVAAADVDVAGAAHGDAVVGVAGHDALVVAGGGDGGGGQDGDDDGSNVDHFGLMRCSSLVFVFCTICTLQSVCEKREGGN